MIKKTFSSKLIIILLLIIICIFFIMSCNSKDNKKSTYFFNKEEICEKIKNAQSIYEDNIKIIKDTNVIKFGNIDFIVVKKNKNKALLMTKNVIDYKYFNKETDDEYISSRDNELEWEDTYLRKYLNNEFYNKFSKEEKQMIITQNLQNPGRKYNYGYDIYDTYDNVFLLSAFEINKYFNHIEDNILNNDVTIKNAIAYDENGNKAQYFLRTRYDRDYYIVDEEGRLKKNKLEQKNGIRPCIVVKYDDYEYSYNNYTEDDDKIDIIKYIIYVKEDIKSKLKKIKNYDYSGIENPYANLDENEIVETFVYSGKPEDRYDDYFIYYDCNGFAKNSNEKVETLMTLEVTNVYDDVRTIYSDVFGRVDIFIDNINYKWLYKTFLDYDEFRRQNFLNEKLKSNVLKYIENKNLFSPEKYLDIIDTCGTRPANMNDLIEIYDKVTFGRVNNKKLIWTVAKAGQYLTLISDYTFFTNLNDIRKNLDTEEYFSNYFTGTELLKMKKINDYRYNIMPYEEFIYIFPYEEDRKVLGCIDGDYIGNKCYYVGGEGRYKASINACDENGELYPAYDLLELPNRICIVVDNQIVEKIENIDDVELFDFEEAKNNYEKDKNKQNNKSRDEFDNIKFFDEDMEINTKIATYKNELVKIGDELKYVDYVGKEQDIKNIIDVNDINVGEYVFYGNANKIIEDDSVKNVDKKIIWRVVDKNNNKMTLHSVFVIDRKREDNEYKDSELRKWLNNDFLQKSFTIEERNRIIETNTKYETDNGSLIELNDKVATLTDEIANENYKDINTKINILSAKDLLKEYIINYTNIEEEKKYPKDEYFHLSFREAVYNIYPEQEYVYVENSNFNSIYNGHYYSFGGINEETCGVMPIISLKFENEKENVYYINDLNFNKMTHHNFVIGANLYFIENKQLKVVNNLNNEKYVLKDDIKTAVENVDLIYKRNKELYIFNNGKIGQDNVSDYGDFYIYIDNDKLYTIDNYISLYLLFNDDDSFNFYKKAIIDRDALYKGEIKLEGQKYFYKNEKIFDDKNTEYSLIEFNNKQKNITNININKNKKTYTYENEIKPLIFYKKNSILYFYDGYNENEVSIVNNQKDRGYVYKADNENYYISITNTDNTQTLKILYYENKNWNLEDLDDGYFSYSTYDYKDGMYYYSRYENEIDTSFRDYISLYAVNKNTAPKEIYKKQLSDKCYYDIDKEQMFYINDKNELVLINKDNTKNIIGKNVDRFLIVSDGLIYETSIDNINIINYYREGKISKIQEGYIPNYTIYDIEKTNNYLLVRNNNDTNANDPYILYYIDNDNIQIIEDKVNEYNIIDKDTIFYNKGLHLEQYIVYKNNKIDLKADESKKLTAMRHNDILYYIINDKLYKINNIEDENFQPEYIDDRVIFINHIFNDGSVLYNKWSNDEKIKINYMIYDDKINTYMSDLDSDIYSYFISFDNDTIYFMKKNGNAYTIYDFYDKTKIIAENITMWSIK